MDKSLGTNLHLWRFFKRAKHPTMLDMCTRYSSRVLTFYGEGSKVTQFKTDNSAFLKLRFENTEN